MAIDMTAGGFLPKPRIRLKSGATPCDANGHAWQRDQAIDKAEVTKAMSDKPQHFFCARVGCKATKVRAWDAGREQWVETVAIPEIATP